MFLGKNTLRSHNYLHVHMKSHVLLVFSLLLQGINLYLITSLDMARQVIVFVWQSIWWYDMTWFVWHIVECYDIARGPSIKYVTLEGKRGSARRCDSLWQGYTGPRAFDVTLLKKFIHLKPKIESDIWFSVVMNIIWQRGTDKNHPDKIFQTITPGQNHGQKPSRTKTNSL